MKEALIYALGVVTGVALIIANHRTIQNALRQERMRMGAQIRQLQNENARLRADQDALERCQEAADARRRGREESRIVPISPAEQFARDWEGKRAAFRGPK